MKYEVRDAQSDTITSTHRTERMAVSVAKSYGDPDRYSVIAHETSGSYESRQQVWPRVGHCYAR